MPIHNPTSYARTHFTIATICPTLSYTSLVNQGLASLEGQLGIKLFIRSGKVLLPTEACLKIESVFKPFSTELEEILELESQHQKIISGKLKVFIPTLVGPILLAKPFLNFLIKHPDVNLALDNGPATAALNEIQNNNFDLGICGLKTLINQHKWCYSEKLLNLSMGLYCSPSFFEKHRRLIKHRQFDSLLFMTGDTSQFLLEWYFNEILHSKFKSPSRFSMYDMSFTVQAVAKGLGIGLLAKELVEHEIKRGHIVDIGTKTLLHPLFLIYQKNKKLNMLERTFVEEIKNYFKSE